jgi:YbbR domain-containing protein
VPSLLGVVTHNWKLKLSAFALAMLLWITVTADQIAVRWLPVEVDTEVRELGYRVVDGPIPQEVEVRITGPRREFWDLAVNRPRVRLVLSDPSEGSNRYRLEPQHVEIPRGRERGLSANDVRPASVTLVVERVTTVSVPVHVQLREGPREGYAWVDTVDARPATVRVSGPAERVGAISRVVTQPIDVSRETGTFERTVELDTTGLRGLEISAEEVEVRGRIERAVQQVIPEVPVQAPPGVLVVPGSVDVQVFGAESVVRRMTSASVRLSVPAEAIPPELPPGGTTAVVRVEQVPAGVRATVEPRIVRILAAPVPVPEVRTPTPAPAQPSPPAASPDTVPAASTPAPGAG